MVLKRSGPGGHEVRLLRLVKGVLMHPFTLAIVVVLIAVALLLSVVPTPKSAGDELPAGGRQLVKEEQAPPTPGEMRDGDQEGGGQQEEQQASETGAETDSQEVTSPIELSGTFDGGGRRFYAGTALGDGGRTEGQKPLFELAPGTVLRNVVLAAPAADGVHCTDGCTLENITWEDVGEDAATFRGDGTNIVRGGSARDAADKVFQFNGSGALSISGFKASNIGKLARSCGTCEQVKRTIEVSDTTVSGVGVSIVKINPNNGDSATLHNVTISGAKNQVTVCEDDGGGEGGGSGGIGCNYSESDVHYQ